MGVDRGRSVSLNSELVKNRRRIMYNCTLFISAVIKNNKLNSLQLSSIDILEENEWYILEQDILSEVIPLIEKKLQEYPKRTSLEDFIRGQIRRRVLIKTDIKPVTTLHLHIEDNEQ
jgi:mRNA degradation ribonuclease J1/J2